jgi:hypothetical protein
MSSPETVLPFAQEQCPLSELFSQEWLHCTSEAGSERKRDQKESRSAFSHSDSAAVQSQGPSEREVRRSWEWTGPGKGWAHGGPGPSLLFSENLQEQN